jgi:hypothetical protein
LQQELEWIENVWAQADGTQALVETFVERFLEEATGRLFALPRLLSVNRPFAYGRQNIGTMLDNVTRIMRSADKVGGS